MILTRDVRLPIGVLSAGSPVEPVADTDAGVTVRVPREHVFATSWTVTLPRDGVTRAGTLRRTCLDCGGSTLADICPECSAHLKRSRRTV